MSDSESRAADAQLEAKYEKAEAEWNNLDAAEKLEWIEPLAEERAKLAFISNLVNE